MVNCSHLMTALVLPFGHSFTPAVGRAFESIRAAASVLPARTHEAKSPDPPIKKNNHCSLSTAFVAISCSTLSLLMQFAGSPGEGSQCSACHSDKAKRALPVCHPSHPDFHASPTGDDG